MKKFFISILAVGALVACTKSEVKYDDASEITFAPVASTVTKGTVIDDVHYPTTIPFNVFSFYAADVEPGPQTDFSKFTKTYLDNKTFEYKSEYGLFGGRDHSYYWPKNGSLVFAGYSPDPTTFSSASQEYDLENGLTIKGFVQSTDTKNTKDLMWFNHTKSSYREVNKVPVKFIHACSWLTFYVSSDTEDANFHIKKLVLNSVKTKADFNGNVPTWKFYDDASYVKDLVVFDSNNNNKIPYGGDPMRIDDEGVIVIPQDCVKATITYTMANGAGVEIEQTETFRLSAGADNDIWKYSRHYIYKIIFSASEILIEPAVNDWIDVTGTEVEVN